jgi:hypothetical protein
MWGDIHMASFGSRLAALILISLFSVASTSAEQITGGVASFDSVGGGGNPFERQAWGNAKGGSSWAQYELPSPKLVKSIYIKSAGTDIRSEGSSITLFIKADGEWKRIYELRDMVINRDFSGGVKGPQVGPVRVNLANPTAITGVRIEMTGHGWFAAEDIRLES